MNEKLQAEEKEAGWEFTLPRYAVNPLNWFFAILIIIALIILLVLVSKIANKQSVLHPSTTQLP